MNRRNLASRQAAVHQAVVAVLTGGHATRYIVSSYLSRRRWTLLSVSTCGSILRRRNRMLSARVALMPAVKLSHQSTRGLIADIAAQLVALDRQREQLAILLRKISIRALWPGPDGFKSRKLRRLRPIVNRHVAGYLAGNDIPITGTIFRRSESWLTHCRHYHIRTMHSSHTLTRRRWRFITTSITMRT